MGNPLRRSISRAGLLVDDPPQAAPVTMLTWTAVPNHPNRVQVVVPKGQAPRVYNLIMNDATGCATLLPKAITMTADLTVTIKSIVPPFGCTGTGKSSGEDRNHEMDYSPGVLFVLTITASASAQDAPAPPPAKSEGRGAFVRDDKAIDEGWPERSARR